MHPLRDQLRALAEQGHGVILTADLRRLGLDPAERASVAKSLVPIRRGAYALDEPADAVAEHLLRTRAALGQASRRAAASHVSAAVTLGLPVPAEFLGVVHLRVASARARVGTRHGVHTHAGLEEVGASMLPDGRLVTDATATVLDCARMLPHTDSVVLADAALNQGLIDLEVVQGALRRLSRHRGVVAARRALTMADAGAESVGESRTRLILVAAGFDVETQVELRDELGRFVARVDLKLRDAPVVIEFDGRAKYSLDGDAKGAHWRDKVRNDRIGNLGFERVRVWWNRLAQPAEIVRDVERARARALGRLSPER